MMNSPRNPDFDEFAGLWSAADAAEFEHVLAQMRQVDPDDWQPEA